MDSDSGLENQWSGGHTFIVVAYDSLTDRVLTLESNSAFKLNGVGYRMIGSFANYPKPSEFWPQNDELWTWSKIKSVYKFRKQATLKVKNLCGFDLKKSLSSGIWYVHFG